MATERLSMRQIREVLRQKWVLGRSHREVAESLRIGLGTVSVVLERATQAGLDWPTVQRDFPTEGGRKRQNRRSRADLARRGRSYCGQKAEADGQLPPGVVEVFELHGRSVQPSGSFMARNARSARDWPR